MSHSTVVATVFIIFKCNLCYMRFCFAINLQNIWPKDYCQDGEPCEVFVSYMWLIAARYGNSDIGISAYTGEAFKYSLIGITSQCSTSFFPQAYSCETFDWVLNYPAIMTLKELLLLCNMQPKLNHHNPLQLYLF